MMMTEFWGYNLHAYHYLETYLLSEYSLIINYIPGIVLGYGVLQFKDQLKIYKY